MTIISNIDEKGINRNLRVRYDRDIIYVSQSHFFFFQENWKFFAGTQFKINFAKIRYANRYRIMLSLRNDRYSV